MLRVLRPSLKCTSHPWLSFSKGLVQRDFWTFSSMFKSILDSARNWKRLSVGPYIWLTLNSSCTAQHICPCQAWKYGNHSFWRLNAHLLNTVRFYTKHWIYDHVGLIWCTFFIVMWHYYYTQWTSVSPLPIHIAKSPPPYLQVAPAKKDYICAKLFPLIGGRGWSRICDMILVCLYSILLKELSHFLCVLGFIWGRGGGGCAVFCSHIGVQKSLIGNGFVLRFYGSHTVKNRIASFPSPAGMSLPNSPWAGIMTS